MVLMSTPARSRWTAVVCRIVCGLTRFVAIDGTVLLACSAYCPTSRWIPNRVNGWLLRFKKTGSSLPRLAISLDSDVLWPATTGRSGTCFPCRVAARRLRFQLQAVDGQSRRLLGTSTASVQEQEQGMISVAESRAPIRLGQQCIHLGRHCQVNRYGDACGRSKRDKAASCYLVDAGLLSPDPEHLRASAAIAGCGHQMAPRPKVIVDYRMRRQEPLCLIGRLEPLHLPLSSSRGSMRILSSIVQVPARPMADIRQDRSLSDAVAAQAVRDEASWLVLRDTARKPEFICRALIVGATDERTVSGRAEPSGAG